MLRQTDPDRWTDRHSWYSVFFTTWDHACLRHLPFFRILLIGSHSALPAHKASLLRCRVPCVVWGDGSAEPSRLTNWYWSSLNTWDMWVIFTYLSIYGSPLLRTFWEDFPSVLNYKINKWQTLLQFCSWGDIFHYWKLTGLAVRKDCLPWFNYSPSLLSLVFSLPI